MNGIQEYDKNYSNKIKNIIAEHKDLKGYYAFLSDKSQSTIYSYLFHIGSFMTYVGKPLDKFDFDDFADYLAKSKYTNKGNISTQQYRITVYHSLKSFGKYLVAKGILHKNPMDSIDRPKSKDSQSTIVKRNNGYLSKEEINILLYNVKNGCGNELSIKKQEKWRNRDNAIIMILLNTGIRCSALYKLDIASVMLDENKILVTDKGGYAKYKIISDATVEAIEKWISERDEILSGTQCEALFISNQKKRLTVRSIENIVKKYTENISGKNISPHKLRATFGTQLYQQTKDIHFVQKAMDHKSADTTASYIRGKDSVSNKASDIMEKLLQI